MTFNALVAEVIGSLTSILPAAKSVKVVAEVFARDPRASAFASMVIFPS